MQINEKKVFVKLGNDVGSIVRIESIEEVNVVFYKEGENEEIAGYLKIDYNSGRTKHYYYTTLRYLKEDYSNLSKL